MAPHLSLSDIIHWVGNNDSYLLENITIPTPQCLKHRITQDPSCGNVENPCPVLNDTGFISDSHNNCDFCEDEMYCTRMCMYTCLYLGLALPWQAPHPIKTM
mmetsp:Transcript_19611/g.28734  ORF Transcript_19611/g.28734 Transcript_19611/m.28734 type:complete len:102 (+) Transcript_19611:1252-1557(+)